MISKCLLSCHLPRWTVFPAIVSLYEAVSHFDISIDGAYFWLGNLNNKLVGS